MNSEQEQNRALSLIAQNLSLMRSTIDADNISPTLKLHRLVTDIDNLVHIKDQITPLLPPLKSAFTDDA